MMQYMPWNNLQAVNYNAENCKTSYLGRQSIFVGIGLTTFNIGAGVQSLPDYLISHCGNLHSVSFPNTVTSILLWALSQAVVHIPKVQQQRFQHQQIAVITSTIGVTAIRRILVPLL